MHVISLYKCLADRQRLRILRLLAEGPLCVCHLVEILATDQVKVSKQLRYMKDLGILKSRRVAQWMIYRLANPRDPLLSTNLQCLDDTAGKPLSFTKDLAQRRVILARLEGEDSACVAALLRADRASVKPST